MPRNSNNNYPNNRLPFDAHQSELADMAAEQIARLFWEQIKHNHRKRNENNDPLRDKL